MKVEVKTNSKTYLLTGILVSIPIVLSVIVGIMFVTKAPALSLLLGIPLFGLGFYVAHRISSTTTLIDVDEEGIIRINEKEIPIQSIEGYHMNDTGLVYSEFCLKQENGKVTKFTGNTLGKSGKSFVESTDKIIGKLKQENQLMKSLTYQDIYVRQMKVLKPILYFLAVSVLVLDIVAVYLIINGKTEVDDPWRILWVNFLLIGLIPYLRKEKKTNANKT